MKPPYHEKFVKDCGYCEDIGDACECLKSELPTALPEMESP